MALLENQAPPRRGSTAASRPLDRAERTRRLGLLTPAAVLLLVVFVLPLGVMLWHAFFEPRPGFGNVAWYLDDAVQRRVLLRTFTTAAKVTAVCLLLGYPYAYAMVAAGPRLRAVLVLVVLIPLWTSLMVRTFAWVILLQDHGLVQNALAAVGLGHPQLIRSNLGVVIGMTQILLPFMVMPLYAVMRSIDRRLVQASSSLGAPPLATFWRVWLPLSLPGVGAGALIVSISSLGFYVTPALLGSPGDSLISQQIYAQVNGLLQWGHGGAMGVVLLVTTLLIVGLVLGGIRRGSRAAAGART